MNGDKKKEHEDAVTIWGCAVMLAIAGGYAAGLWSGVTILFWLSAFLFVGLAVRAFLWLSR